MISLDHIGTLVTYLDRITTSRPNVAGELVNYLRQVFEADSYQRWLVSDQFLGAARANGWPPEPPEAARALPGSKRLLDQFLFSAFGNLQVKVDRHFDRVHVTDGLWVDPAIRVYPFTDESEILCKYITDNKLDTHADTLIDPACGCGHHAIALGSHRFKWRYSFDINLRAIGFARLNAILHKDTRHIISLNDIRDGLPSELACVRGGVVFAVNMPFAIQPSGNADPFTGQAQHGGDRADELTLAALEALANFSHLAPLAGPVRAVVLCYSLGRKVEGGDYEWQLLAAAKDLFGADRVKFLLLTGERLWRVNGLKEEPNPMSVSKINRKADCLFTYTNDEREKARAKLDTITDKLKAENWTEIGYGLLDIDIPIRHATAGARGD